MSTARNRAIAAAQHPTVASGLLPTPAEYAEAASDVWEPLLREALSVIYTLTEGTSLPEALDIRILILEENLT